MVIRQRDGAADVGGALLDDCSSLVSVDPPPPADGCSDKLCGSFVMFWDHRSAEELL